MTAPQQQKEKTAAVFFAGFMALALGGAGVLVAALAVGIEQAWSGGATERGRARQRGRGWLANQRAWLDADHAQRMAAAQERREWLEAGGDPAAEPAKPSRARRAGAALRRAVAHVALGASDFAAGARDGAKAANETRKEGGGFAEIARTRPGAAAVCSNCKRAGIPVVRDGLCADCVPAAAREQTAAPAPAGQTCRGCRRPVPVGFDGYCTTCRPASMPGTPAPSGQAGTPSPPAPPKPALPRPASPAPSPAAAPIPDALRGWDDPRVRARARQYAPNCSLCGAVMVIYENLSAQGHHSNHVYYRCTSCQIGQVGLAWWELDNDVRDHPVWQPRPRPSAARTTQPPKPPPTSASMPAPAPPTAPTPDRNREHRRILIHCSVCGAPCIPRVADLAEATAWNLSQYVCPDCRNKPTEGAPMASPNQPTAPAAESNATVLRAKLDAAKTTLHNMADSTDRLANDRAALDRQVRDAEEFASATGQSAQARQALDEAKAVSEQMGVRLGEFSQGAVSAEDQMAQASAGLKVAESAEDELRAAGADGRAVAPAGGDA